MILDSEVTNRGAPDTPEGSIRRAFAESGLVETVLACGGPFQARRQPRGSLARMILPQAVLLIVSKRPRWEGRVLLIDGSPVLDSYAYGEASMRSGTETVLRICRERAIVPSVSTIATATEIAGRGYDLTPRHWIERAAPMAHRPSCSSRSPARG